MTLPSHAQTTLLNIFSGTRNGNGAGNDIFVCAVVMGSIADVTHQTFREGTGNLCIQRQGTVQVDGASSPMSPILSQNGCNLSTRDILATLTHKRKQSDLYSTKNDGGSSPNSDLVITLGPVNACLQP